MCSHGVPSKFLMGSQYVPQYVLHLSTSLLFHMLWQIFSFHLYVGLKGGTIYIKTEPSILTSLHSFLFWGAMGQSNWLVDPPKRKKEVGRHFLSLLTLLLITWLQWTSTHHRTIHSLSLSCGWTSTGLIFSCVRCRDRHWCGNPWPLVTVKAPSFFKPYLFPLNRERASPEPDGSGGRASSPKGPPLPLRHWFNEGCCVERGGDRWRGPFRGKSNQSNKRDPKF